MIIVLLAGGIGERMKKTGQLIPKTLLPIGSKPVINYLIDGFDLDSGNIDKIYILTRTAQETTEGKPLELKTQFENWRDIFYKEHKDRFEIVCEDEKDSVNEKDSVKFLKEINQELGYEENTFTKGALLALYAFSKRLKEERKFPCGEPFFVLAADNFSRSRGLNIEETRKVYEQAKRDKESRKRLAEWGPADGYIMRVGREILADSRRLRAICDDEVVYPHTIEFHPGPSCPCSCIFCYSKGRSFGAKNDSGYRIDNGGEILAPHELISMVEALVGKGLRSVCISGGLEPLAYTGIRDLIRNMPKEIPADLITNGFPRKLDDDLIDLLIERCRSVRFSINAATAETFDIVQMPERKGATDFFPMLLEKMDKAVATRDRLLSSGEKAAEIGVAFLCVPENVGELELSIRLWASKGIDFFSLGNEALIENPRTESLNGSQTDKANSLLHGMRKRLGLENFKLYMGRGRIQKHLRRPSKCYAPFYRFVIDFLGNVWSCCMRAHPALQHDSFLIGRARNGAELVSLIQKEFGKPAPRRRFPLGFHCSECTEKEFLTNVWTEKFIQDLRFGIDLSEQPFL